jgi:ATP-dependent DNA helicase MPH1
MSDDFDDDSFLIDDSFLREVDYIAAKASERSTETAQRQVANSNGIIRASSLHSASLKPTARGWTGPQHHTNAGPSYRPSASGLSHKSKPYKAPQVLHQHTVSAQPPPPSSDDYDELAIPAESLLVLDHLKSAPRTSFPPPRARPASLSVIPSSRLQRTSSGSSDPFFQTHLNFRKDNQSTKGKRWDRTEFAESGRRINTNKVKEKDKARAKAKIRFGDEDEEEEEDIGEEEEEGWSTVVPGPKPFVDPSQSPLTLAYSPLATDYTPQTPPMSLRDTCPTWSHLRRIYTPQIDLREATSSI